MANEITLSASLSFLKNTKTDTLAVDDVLIDMSGTDFLHASQNVAITEEALNLGDITIPGFILLKNLDSANYMEIRPATGVADCVRVNAGETTMFRFAADATAPFVIANTATVEIEYLLIEA